MVSIQRAIMRERRKALAEKIGWHIKRSSFAGEVDCYGLVDPDGLPHGYQGFHTEHAVWDDDSLKFWIKFRSEHLSCCRAHLRLAVSELWAAIRGRG